MKDGLKRVLIVGALLILGILMLYFAISNYSKPEEINHSTNNEQYNVVTNQEENVELPTDVLETYTSSKARVKTNLNFREKSNTESKIINTIPQNTVVDVISKLRNGWYKIKHQENIGFVSGEYIQILTEEEMNQVTVDKEYTNTYAIANVDDVLNIREQANINSNKLTYVKPKSILKVFSKMKNRWYKVEGNACVGYVSHEYIKILSNDEYEALAPTKNNMIDPSRNLIATYTSKSSYNENSRYNMHLAADYINGTIVKPGETYSHLAVVHPKGVENKYVDSTIFVGDGKVAQGNGGGICQTSSTTYAAIASAMDKGIDTGLNVTQQAPHSGKVNYVPREYEATVSTGSIDFCFRNINNYSIKIEAIYNYNTLTINIYKI